MFGLDLEFYPKTAVSGKSFIHIFNTETDVRLHHYKPPEDIINFASAVVDDKIYIIGGKYALYHTISSAMQMFDIGNQRWSRAPPLPQPLRNAAATSVMDRWIVVTGGQSEYGNYQLNGKIYVYDTLSQQWSESEIELSPPRVWHQCITVGSQIVCRGGTDILCRLCPMETIEIKYVIRDWRYERIKHFILLRKLVEKGRASPFVKDKKREKEALFVEVEEVNKVIQIFLMELNLDMFRNVLSFLL